MTTKLDYEDLQLLTELFNEYCLLLYNRTYPLTDKNLFNYFLEEMWNEFLIENSGHIKYDKRCYEKLTKYIEPSHLFIKNLKNFIKKHDQTAI